MYQKHLEICRAATPGEWAVTCLGDNAIYITKDYRVVDGIHRAYWIAEIDSGDDEKSVETKFADAEFIAFARNHAEQYITRCMELEVELQLTTAQNKKLESAAIDKHLRIQGLEAEVKRLRDAVVNSFTQNESLCPGHLNLPEPECCTVYESCDRCWRKALGVTP